MFVVLLKRFVVVDVGGGGGGLAIGGLSANCHCHTTLQEPYNSYYVIMSHIVKILLKFTLKSFMCGTTYSLMLLVIDFN